ncbi:MAG TPA: hypothetical protein VG096_15350 [Bryobacteraceae bacterium]|nr:hypothetical protein [Bryobacteraceae bacterium]
MAIIQTIDDSGGMPSQQSAQEADVLLEQWFAEGDAGRAQALMESLVCHHAEPLIRRIVSFKLALGGDPLDRRSHQADTDDVCGTALYNLLARLERIKSGDNEAAVRNFTGYAAVTAYNACHEYFRSRKPAWFRLSMKLRYLGTHAPKFAVWQTAEGRDVCGLARDRGREPDSDLGRLRKSCQKLWENQHPGAVSFPKLVEAIVGAAGAPLIFEDLVDAVADCLGIAEARVQSLDEDRGDDSPRWELPTADPPADARLRERQFIERLWKEICDLPLEHRKALLFNLQDSAGGDIQLFDFLGIATVAQIAAVVEMEPLAFAELWKRLPLDDTSIGRELGLSRQDVANRRSSARKRLARRMNELERGN